MIPLLNYRVEEGSFITVIYRRIDWPESEENPLGKGKKTPSPPLFELSALLPFFEKELRWPAPTATVSY